MRIGTRLFVGFGSICCILAVVAGISVFESEKLQSTVARVAELRAPASQTSANIGSEVFISIADLRGYLLTKNETLKNDRQRAWRNIAALTQSLDQLSSRFTDTRNNQLWSAAKQTLEELRQIQDRAEQAPSMEQAVKILEEEAVPRAMKLRSLLYGDTHSDGQYTGGLIGNQKQHLEDDIREADSSAGFMEVAALIGLVAGVISAVAVAFITSKSVVPPLVKITEVMKVLSGGDLSVAIPHKENEDEVGEMAAALGIFQSNLVKQKELEAQQRAEERAKTARTARIAELTAQFDQTASNTVQTVASAAHQLQGTAESLSAAATQTSHQATSVSAASEEASVNVQTVASAAEELSSSINEIGRQVAHSSNISSNAAAEAVKAEEVVGELTVAVQKIGDVVKLINDIASQTNLLALNATIEAARAGEAGKGFAVVANEVKSLANQTGKATEEIGQQIASVQEQTSRVVGTIQGIVKVIEDIGRTSGEISAAVEQQSAATTEIAHSVEQAAAGTAEVSSNVVGIQAAAQHTGEASEEMLSASKNLAAEADNLRQVINSFLTDVRSA